jgi:starch phosphorylase
VRDYTTELYEPAAASADRALAQHGAVARDLASWKVRVNAAWPVVRVVGVEADTNPAHEGDHREVRATVEIDGLEPSSVVVQALHGSIDREGTFVDAPATVVLQHQGGNQWQGTYVVAEAGPYGLTVRAMPAHDSLISPVELGLAAWAN